MYSVMITIITTYWYTLTSKQASHHFPWKDHINELLHPDSNQTLLLILLNSQYFFKPTLCLTCLRFLLYQIKYIYTSFNSLQTSLLGNTFHKYQLDLSCSSYSYAVSQIQAVYEPFFPNTYLLHIFKVQLRDHFFQDFSMTNPPTPQAGFGNLQASKLASCTYLEKTLSVLYCYLCH